MDYKIVIKTMLTPSGKRSVLNSGDVVRVVREYRKNPNYVWVADITRRRSSFIKCPKNNLVSPVNLIRSIYGKDF